MSNNNIGSKNNNNEVLIELDLATKPQNGSIIASQQFADEGPINIKYFTRTLGLIFNAEPGDWLLCEAQTIYSEGDLTYYVPKRKMVFSEVLQYFKSNSSSVKLYSFDIPLNPFVNLLKINSQTELLPSGNELFEMIYNFQMSLSDLEENELLFPENKSILTKAFKELLRGNCDQILSEILWYNQSGKKESPAQNASKLENGANESNQFVALRNYIAILALLPEIFEIFPKYEPTSLRLALEKPKGQKELRKILIEDFQDCIRDLIKQGRTHHLYPAKGHGTIFEQVTREITESQLEPLRSITIPSKKFRGEILYDISELASSEISRKLLKVLGVHGRRKWVNREMLELITKASDKVGIPLQIKIRKDPINKILSDSREKEIETVESGREERIRFYESYSYFSRKMEKIGGKTEQDLMKQIIKLLISDKELALKIIVKAIADPIREVRLFAAKMIGFFSEVINFQQIDPFLEMRMKNDLEEEIVSKEQWLLKRDGYNRFEREFTEALEVIASQKEDFLVKEAVLEPIDISHYIAELSRFLIIEEEQLGKQKVGERNNLNKAQDYEMIIDEFQRIVQNRNSIMNNKKKALKTIDWFRDHYLKIMRIPNFEKPFIKILKEFLLLPECLIKTLLLIKRIYKSEKKFGLKVVKEILREAEERSVPSEFPEKSFANLIETAKYLVLILLTKIDSREAETQALEKIRGDIKGTKKRSIPKEIFKIIDNDQGENLKTLIRTAYHGGRFNLLPNFSKSLLTLYLEGKLPREIIEQYFEKRRIASKFSDHSKRRKMIFEYDPAERILLEKTLFANPTKVLSAAKKIIAAPNQKNFWRDDYYFLRLVEETYKLDQKLAYELSKEIAINYNNYLIPAFLLLTKDIDIAIQTFIAMINSKSSFGEELFRELEIQKIIKFLYKYSQN